MAKTHKVKKASTITLPNTNQILRSLRPGQTWYFAEKASDLTYIKTRYGIQIKTEVLICVNEATLKAEKITKVTMISNPHVSKISVLDTIKADEVLLRWARGSIRFNSTRENQAIDFRSKVSHLFPDASLDEYEMVLTQIEEQDNAN